MKNKEIDGILNYLKKKGVHIMLDIHYMRKAYETEKGNKQMGILFYTWSGNNIRL